MDDDDENNDHCVLCPINIVRMLFSMIFLLLFHLFFVGWKQQTK